MTKTRSKRYISVKVSSTKTRQQHVLIAEKALGHPLPVGAQVHHVNGNGRDNRNQNLVICEDASYHKILHVRQRVIEYGGDPNIHRICATCLKPKSTSEFKLVRRYPAKQGSYCRTCQHSYDLRRQREKRASMPRIPRNLYQTSKTHCKQGHPFIPENIFVDNKRPNVRVCRTCQRAWALARYYRKKQEDCEDADKIALFIKLGEMLGVDLGPVFPKGSKGKRKVLAKLAR